MTNLGASCEIMPFFLTISLHMGYIFLKLSFQTSYQFINQLITLENGYKMGTEG
jgi:hypothetical protein